MATSAERRSISSQPARLNAGAIERAVSLAVLLLVCLAIILGWLNRHQGWIDPEQGFGYALGVIGASMMLLLLGYPLRKRRGPSSRVAGTVGFWFRFHMLLGLLGPLAILFHSRFTFGAVNSAVALGAMIVVASSGLIGRFLYSRVHRGYSDRKLEVRALKQEMDTSLAQLKFRGMSREDVLARLQVFEDCAVAAGGRVACTALLSTRSLGSASTAKTRSTPASAPWTVCHCSPRAASARFSSSGSIGSTRSHRPRPPPD